MHPTQLFIVSVTWGTVNILEPHRRNSNRSWLKMNHRMGSPIVDKNPTSTTMVCLHPTVFTKCTEIKLRKHVSFHSVNNQKTTAVYGSCSRKDPQPVMLESDQTLRFNSSTSLNLISSSSSFSAQSR